MPKVAQRLLAFVETPNQLRMADHLAARLASSGVAVDGFTLPRLLKFAKSALLTPHHFGSLFFPDRQIGHLQNLTELNRCLLLWLAAVERNYAAFVFFNDGTRYASLFARHLVEAKRPVVTVQDGFMGHVTRANLPTSIAFQATLDAEVDGARWATPEGLATTLAAALQDADPAQPDTATGTQHCSTVKIGAARGARYLVQSEDMAAKVVLRHRVPLQDMTIVGMPLPSDDGVCQPATNRVLYVGQCHILHGKALREPWFADLAAVFDALGGQAAVYKAHPGDSPEFLELTRKAAPPDVAFERGGFITAEYLKSFAVIVTETSSVCFQAASLGLKTIVIEAPSLSERLPHFRHEAVLFTDLENLKAALRYFERYGVAEGRYPDSAKFSARFRARAAMKASIPPMSRFAVPLPEERFYDAVTQAVLGLEHEGQKVLRPARKPAVRVEPRHDPCTIADYVEGMRQQHFGEVMTTLLDTSQPEIRLRLFQAVLRRYCGADVERLFALFPFEARLRMCRYVVRAARHWPGTAGLAVSLAAALLQEELRQERPGRSIETMSFDNQQINIATSLVASMRAGHVAQAERLARHFVETEKLHPAFIGFARRRALRRAALRAAA